MNEEFNKWWDNDLLTEDNPFVDGTPAYWAWEGWCAKAALAKPDFWEGYVPEPVKPAQDNSNYRLDPPGLAQLYTSPPAQRKPLTRNQVKKLITATGYDTASPQERTDFINGIRHAEAAHGIKENT